MPTGVKTAAIILAAGRGLRLGEAVDGPKQYQFLDTSGKTTVLSKTLAAFLESEDIDVVQVVIHPDDHELYAAAIRSDPKLLPPVPGGRTRQESSLYGLRALIEINPDQVLIHDAARPFVSLDLLTRTLASIREGLCALPALPVSDTLKKAEETETGKIVSATIPRDNLYYAQTPQGFVYRAILAAHDRAAEQNIDDFTDDCSVAEWAGMKTRIVEGAPENLKITTFDDLENAIEMNRIESEFKVPDIRTGIGYDVHRLVSGDGIILCGVKLPSDKKLDGHSDADVALHAITDALLGTICDGDIGNHFPPSDPVWKDAASDQFLAHACALVREKSGVITHLDVTIICEEPKIGPHRDAMRESIAKICQIDPDRVSVKATTHEKIGTIGRGEGIAAMATASVVIVS